MDPPGKVLIGARLLEQFITEDVDERGGEDLSVSFLISLRCLLPVTSSLKVTLRNTGKG